MLPASQRTLSFLVALKKQHAEQKLLSLLQTVRRIEAEIARLRDGLSSIHANGTEDGTNSLLVNQHFVERCVSEIQNLELKRANLLDELEQAKHKLRRALFSDSQIRRSNG